MKFHLEFSSFSWQKNNMSDVVSIFSDKKYPLLVMVFPARLLLLGLLSGGCRVR